MGLGESIAQLFFLFAFGVSLIIYVIMFVVIKFKLTARQKLVTHATGQFIGNIILAQAIITIFALYAVNIGFVFQSVAIYVVCSFAITVYYITSKQSKKHKAEARAIEVILAKEEQSELTKELNKRDKKHSSYGKSDKSLDTSTGRSEWDDFK